MRYRVFAVLLWGLFYTIGGSAEAEFLRINRITMDGNRWGARTFTIPFENLVDDSARVLVTLTISYRNHYLSGHEETVFDTSYTIPPQFTGDKKLEFNLDGSFGQARMDVVLKWRHDSDPDSVGYDSLNQMFSNNFAGRQGSQGLDTYRYVIGPAHAAMEDRQFCFEYPRLLLFLTARGSTVDAVDQLMHPDSRYTWAIAEHFYDIGLFPDRPETTAPAVLALDETEGFAVREHVLAFNKEFDDWYKDKGSEEITRFCREAEIDSSVFSIPAFRMLFLYSLLIDEWSENKPFAPRFLAIDDDNFALNHVHWIIQGGEFFQPRVCFGAYIDDTANILNCGLFEPDPSLPCFKTGMETMHLHAARAHKISGIAMQAVSGEQMAMALKIAKKKKCGKAILKKLGDSIAKSREGLSFYTDLLEPCLADYFVRMALGDSFKGERPFALEKCFMVRY